MTTAARLRHVRAEYLGTQEGPGQPNLQVPLPALQAQVLEARHRQARAFDFGVFGCIVDQAVDPTVAFTEFGEPATALLRIGDVESNGPNRGPRSARQLGCVIGGSFGAQVGQHRSAAGFNNSFSVLATEQTGTTGDQHHPPGHVEAMQHSESAVLHGDSVQAGCRLHVPSSVADRGRSSSAASRAGNCSG